MVHAATLRLILADYDRDAERRSREHEWWRAEQEPYHEILRRVGLANLFEKRHPHQYLLRRGLPQRAVEALGAVESELRNAATFDELFKIVRCAFQRYPGLGELAIYDAADRLRHRLGLRSVDTVYLHRGARDGARVLLGRFQRGQSQRIERSLLPAPLHERCPHEIEDILCVYKDQFSIAPGEFKPRFSGTGPSPCGPRTGSSRRC